MSTPSTEIPEDILQLLKCSKCMRWLSWGPVFLCSDKALCNKCRSTPSCFGTFERKVYRNTQYEALASFLLFPCRYPDCNEKISFSDPAANEGACSLHQQLCSIICKPACKWSGSADQILVHCQQQHKDRVVKSPLKLTHDITKSNSYSYLFQAFNAQFQLVTKVCTTSGNIYYTIRYLGNSSEAVNFEYTVNIARNQEKLTKNGRVVPKGSLAIDKDSSLVVNTNSLLQILGGIKDTTFTVTLTKVGGMEKCIKCNLLLKETDYRDSEGWKCEYCAPYKEKCKSINCKYWDFTNKIGKHVYFCNFLNYCIFCHKEVSKEILIHYEEKHFSCLNGSPWRVEKIFSAIHAIQTDAGNAICKYEWFNTYFKLSVYTPLSNGELSKIYCSIKLTQVVTGQTRTYNPDTLYNQSEDWEIQVTNNDFSIWSDIYDITVSLKKI